MGRGIFCVSDAPPGMAPRLDGWTDQHRRGAGCRDEKTRGLAKRFLAGD